jgi:hypothetical protein
MLTIEKPWLNEPDYEYFTHKGVECLVARKEHTGHLNGYIALPQLHPWYMVNNVKEVEMNFPWSITLSERHDLDGVYMIVLGFDNFSSYCPKLSVGDPKTYRTFEWTKEQVKKLAAEARSVGKAGFQRSRRKAITQAWNYPWNLIK